MHRHARELAPTTAAASGKPVSRCNVYNALCGGNHDIAPSDGVGGDVNATAAATSTPTHPRNFGVTASYACSQIVCGAACSLDSSCLCISSIVAGSRTVVCCEEGALTMFLWIESCFTKVICREEGALTMFLWIDEINHFYSQMKALTV